MTNLAKHKSVRKLRKRRPRPKPEPGSIDVERAVRAKHPNHVWMTDITDVPTWFGLVRLKLVVVLDVFSRFPLAYRLFPKEPTGVEVAALVTEAAERFGSPKHFVTDRGTQFSGLDQ